MKNGTKSHKYSTRYQYVTVHGRSEKRNVRLSEHASNRWDERTPPWSMSPESALQESQECFWLAMDAFKSFSGVVPDHVHYIAEWHTEDADTNDKEMYESLLMERNQTITTVYHCDFISNKPVNAYLNTLKQEYKNDV